MMQGLRTLLLALSGAREEILERCPTERVKFESLGWAILITSGMATVSMWFALSSAMGVNGILAVIPALAWGLVIMGVDRWLITSLPIEGKRRFGIAAPRVVLAVLLGTLISTPFVLRVFQSEINAQISIIKQDRYSAFLTQQQNSKVAQQVTSARNQVSNLQKVIDSNGAAPLNPSADPEVQLLTKQLNKWLALKQQYYKQWQCQLYGGSGCPKGNGPLAKTSHDNYVQAQNEVGALQARIQQRDNQLASNDTTEQKARYDQAVNALPAAQQQLKIVTARQNALQANYYAQNQATNGILIRLQALSQLSHDDFTVTVARYLLFLLFLVIECLPVTVKLLQHPGPYEKILLAARESELKDGRRFYRGQSRLGMGGLLPESGGETIRAGQAEADVNARAIFNQTKVLPRTLGHPVDEQETEAVRHQSSFTPPSPSDFAEDEGAFREERPRTDWYQDATSSYAGPGRHAGSRPADEQPDGGAPYPGETRRDHPFVAETRLDEPRQGGSRHEDTQPVRPRPARRYADTGELPVVHQDLHGMEDDRVSASSDGHSGAVPLRWDDE
jgi:hypothetical protein